jgi:hypothetical protein
MQNYTFPHLTQKGGAWLVVDLPEWTPQPNVLIPLKRKKLYPLDAKIAGRIKDEMQLFRFNPDQCIITTRHSIQLRTPYLGTQEFYTVQYNRAILAAWFQFSYHNWLENAPPETVLGRMCESATCKNPRHYVLGQRGTRIARALFEPSEEITHDIKADDADWIDLMQAIDNKIAEDLACEDPIEKIMASTIAFAQDLWGKDRAIPFGAGYTSIREYVEYKLKPTGELPSARNIGRNDLVTTQELLDMLKRPKGDG